MSTAVAALVALVGLAIVYWAATGLGLFNPSGDGAP